MNERFYIDTRLQPPLDLPAPEGKSAEWALLRLAAIKGVEAKFESWDDLARAILAKDGIEFHRGT